MRRGKAHQLDSEQWEGNGKASLLLEVGLQKLKGRDAAARFMMSTLAGRVAKLHVMESPEITCPYCWQTITVEESPQIEGTCEFVTDCEVCCRPIRVTATWELSEGGELRLDAQPES